MGLDTDRFKNKNDEQKRAWLDWLSDDVPNDALPSNPPPAPSPSSQPMCRQAPLQTTQQPPASRQVPVQPAPTPTPPLTPRAFTSAPVPRWDSLPTSSVAPVTAPSRPVASSPPVRSAAPSVYATPPRPPMPVAPPIAPKLALPAVSSTSGEPAPTVSIQINLPKLAMPDVASRFKPVVSVAQSTGKRLGQGYARLRAVSTLRLASIGSAVLVLAITGVVGYQQLSQQNVKKAAQATAVVNAKALAPVTSKPTFKPVAPKSEPELATGKPGITTYDGTRDSYSYTDKFMGREILISQQALPAEFSSASEAATKVSQRLKATQSIPTTHGTAFMLSDTKSGQQTIVYAVNNVLVFIQSPFSRSVTDWQGYLNNLV